MSTHVFGIVVSDFSFFLLRDSGDLYPISGKWKLFSYIVQNTQKVTIESLEYCGNAHHISIGRTTMYDFFVCFIVAIKS